MPRVDNGCGFAYPPLPEGVDAIRILTINPGDFSHPLACTLRVAAFSEKPRYAALSYTWNDSYQDNSVLPTSKPSPVIISTGTTSIATTTQSKRVPMVQKARPGHITLNNYRFPIHHNLHLCMLYLRSPTHPLTLWVDAVCINQDDTDESNKQVAIMSFIYSRAQKVIAWLGVKHPAIHVDRERYRQEQFSKMSTDWKAGESSRLAACLADEVKMRYTPALDKDVLSRLADSTYWTRLWIVQEACLAYDLVFVYGPCIWRFDRMHRLDLLKDIPRHDTDERMRYDAMLRLIDARLARHTDATKLENLIERFRKQACSDPRDRVYGLVGLANDVRPFSGTDPHNDIPASKNIEARLVRTQSLNEPFRLPGIRGKGKIRIDRRRSFFNIWKDVVVHAFSCDRPTERPWDAPMSSRNSDTFSKLKGEERKITVVRTAGIVQEALGQNIESEHGDVYKESHRLQHPP